MVTEETGGWKPDPAGPASGWEFVGELWGDVADVTARERFQIGQLDSGISTNVTIRFDARVNATCRLKHGPRTLYVKGPPIKDARLRQMTLTCEERTN